VLVEDCVMNEVATSIDVDMHYDCDDDGGGGSTIDLANFTFRNLDAYGTTKAAGSYDCQSTAPCHDFVLDGVRHHDVRKYRGVGFGGLQMHTSLAE
jgi:hypothetical protein